MNLEHILEKAKENHEGFKEIYDLTINQLFSFVLLRTKDRDKALDLCQDIYLSFWRSLPNFQYMGDAHFYAFLFKVARRQIIKARIKNVEEVRLDDIFDIQAPEAQKEDHRFLLKEIDRLSEKEKLCIELRYFSDLKFSEIASILETTENNSKVLHHRAITKLKEFTSKYE